MVIKSYSARDLTDKSIVIYGAGDYGSKCYLNLSGENKIVIGFVDGSPQKIDTLFLGYRVYSIDAYKNNETTYVVASKYHWREMVLTLVNKGIQRARIIIYYSTDVYVRLNEFKNDELDEYFAERKLPNKWLSFDYHLVEHCNLNCKGCLHFSNIAEKEYADINDFKKNIQRIKMVFGGRVKHIALLGGEPFLHPNIIDFVKIARLELGEVDIEVITNGTLLLNKDDAFWNEFNQYNPRLTLTFYPELIDYSKVVDLLKKMNVTYSINMVNGNEWCKLKLNLRGDSVPRESFTNCYMSNDCVTLDKFGHLYTCAPAAHIHHFVKRFNVDIEVTPSDYIDINEEDNPEDIFEKLALPKPICRYCSKNVIEDANGWGISNKDKNEWL